MSQKYVRINVHPDIFAVYEARAHDMLDKTGRQLINDRLKEGITKEDVRNAFHFLRALKTQKCTFEGCDRSASGTGEKPDRCEGHSLL